MSKWLPERLKQELSKIGFLKTETPEEKASKLQKEIQEAEQALKDTEGRKEPTGLGSGVAKIGKQKRKDDLQRKIGELKKKYDTEFGELSLDKQPEVSRNQAQGATKIAPSSQREEVHHPSKETHTPPMQPEVHEAPSQGQGWAEWALKSSQVYITPGSFIYDMVKNSFYQDRLEEEVQRKLEGSYALTPEEVRDINKALRDEIEKMSKVEPKKDESKKELVYEIDGDTLTQKTGANGKYDFKPSANFTGTLSINRTDPSTGKILDDQVDIIHFENGKVVSLIPADHGERMFNSLGAEVERKARGLGSPSRTGVKVASHKPGDVGEVIIEKADVGHVFTPPTPPVAPGGSRKQHKGQARTAHNE